MPAVLRDYHDRGFRVITEALLPVASPLKLVPPGCHPVDAKVRWSLCGQAGCLFDEPIKEELLTRALEFAHDQS